MPCLYYTIFYLLCQPIIILIDYIRYSPLKGKVVCGCCGHVMQTSSTKNFRFKCDFTRTMDGAECNRLSVNAAELEKMIFGIISQQSCKLLKLPKTNEVDLNYSEYDCKIGELQGEKREFYEKFVVGEIGIDEYKKSKTAIEAEIIQLNVVKSVAVEKVADYTTVMKMKKLAEIVKSAGSLTKDLSDLRIDRVRIYPNSRVEVDWKIKDFCKD